VAEDRRKNERYTAATHITVYDCLTKQSLGELVNLSSEGAMFVTSEPVKPATVFRCRVQLKQQVKGHSEVHFEAECRWCRKNISMSRWESGYLLKASGDDAYLLTFLVLEFKLSGGGDQSMPEVKTIDLANRRRAVRFDFDDSFPVYEQRSYRQLGMLADLSIEGCRIITEKPIRKGDILKCRVKLPRKVFRQEFLMLSIHCRWSRRLKSGTHYESGHIFETISSENAAVVLHLIIHYGKPQHGEKKILVVG